MSLIYMEQIRGYPYLSMNDIAKEFGQSRKTVYNRIRGIEQEMKNGRYNQYAILESGGNPRINYYVYVDYEKHWKMLEDKRARKYVPEFKPNEIAEICGFCQKMVTAE